MSEYQSSRDWGQSLVNPTVDYARSTPKPQVSGKLWLWRNFVDGRPEYWAFDNPYPVYLNSGDPQTLGEPCGYAIFKPSRVGRTDRTEEQVLAAVARSNAPLPTHQRLMKFYGVTTLEALVDKQAYHVERLQEKLPPTPSLAPQRVREG